VWRKRAPRSRDDGDDLVPLVTLDRVQAELVAGRLRDSGIESFAFGTGAAGAEPSLDWAEGTRVMTRRRDAERAITLLDDWLGRT